MTRGKTVRLIEDRQLELPAGHGDRTASLCCNMESGFRFVSEVQARQAGSPAPSTGTRDGQGTGTGTGTGTRTAGHYRRLLHALSYQILQLPRAFRQTERTLRWREASTLISRDAPDARRAALTHPQSRMAARAAIRRLASDSLRAAAANCGAVEIGGSRHLCIAAASGASSLHRRGDPAGPCFSGRQTERSSQAPAGFAAYQQVRNASWGSWGSGGGAKAAPVVPAGAVPAEHAQAGAASAAEQVLGVASQAVDAAAVASTSGGSEVAMIADASWYPVLALQYLIENVHLTLGVPWCGLGARRRVIYTRMIAFCTYKASSTSSENAYTWLIFHVVHTPHGEPSNLSPTGGWPLWRQRWGCARWRCHWSSCR